MYPHERSLVKRYEGKPFVILGVNTDAEDDLGEVKALQKDGNITWRSWWDRSTSGPICRQWRVSSFPTIYLIDHKGVIRHVNLRGKALDEAIEKLVNEAEGGSS